MNQAAPVLVYAAEVRVHRTDILLTFAAPYLQPGRTRVEVAMRHILVSAIDSNEPDVKILLPVDVDVRRFSARLANGVLEVFAQRPTSDQGSGARLPLSQPPASGRSVPP